MRELEKSQAQAVSMLLRETLFTAIVAETVTLYTSSWLFPGLLRVRGNVVNGAEGSRSGMPGRGGDCILHTSFTSRPKGWRTSTFLRTKDKVNPPRVDEMRSVTGKLRCAKGRQEMIQGGSLKQYSGLRSDIFEEVYCLWWACVT
jgi:hypothetical protein